MKCSSRKVIRSEKGFTLTEVIVVTALIAILAAIAAPSFIDYRRSIEYRKTARSIASILRQAKSQAIQSNLEQRVVVKSAGYGIEAGNKAYNTASDGWSSVTNYTTIPSSVITSPLTTIQFTPNGTASSVGDVNINDNDGKTRFRVSVISIGRISITQP